MKRNLRSKFVTIRVAVIPHDLAGIRDCRQAALEKQKRGILNSQRRFLNADAVASGSVIGVVAQENIYPWRIVGTADLCLVNNGNRAIIRNVFVRPTERGAGVGTKLILELENYINVDFLSLSVETQNHPALSLYKRCGYAAPGINGVLLLLSELTGLNMLISLEKKVCAINRESIVRGASRDGLRPQSYPVKVLQFPFPTSRLHNNLLDQSDPDRSREVFCTRSLPWRNFPQCPV